MKKIIILVLFFSIMFFLWHMKNGLLIRNPDAIRDQLIQETPIGLSVYEVEKKLKERGLKPALFTGYGALEENKELVNGIWASSISANLGEYSLFPFFITSVVAFYGFDEEYTLVDIFVRKSVDSL